MFKKSFAIALAIMSVLLSGCGSKDYGTEFTTEPLTDEGYSVEHIVVEIPGLTQDYDLLLVADLHMLYDNEEVYSEDEATVQARLKEFSPDGGATSAAELWTTMPKMLDNCNADYILFAGDMVDFNSIANMNSLKEGMNSLKTPYVYVKSDHDVIPFFMNVAAGECDEAAIARQSDIGVTSSVWYVDLGEIVILCYNRSDKVLTSEGMDVVREAKSLGKPIILLSHVPFNSWVDGSLDATSRAAFGDRNLTWDQGGTTEYTYLDAVGCDFLSLLHDSDSGIKEVVCGHLHYSWDGEISEGIRQHIFAPAFTKSIGYIEIRGTQE